MPRSHTGHECCGSGPTGPRCGGLIGVIVFVGREGGVT